MKKENDKIIGKLYANMTETLEKSGLSDASYSFCYWFLKSINQNESFEKFSIRVNEHLNQMSYLSRLSFNIEIKQLPVQKITHVDISTCERLMDAYQKSMKGFDKKKQIGKQWLDEIKLNEAKKELIYFAENGMAEQMALKLNAMFYLLTNGTSYSFPKHKAYEFLIKREFLRRFGFLAEYLGLTPIDYAIKEIDDNKQYAFEGNLESLIKKIEKNLNISMNFPKTCGAWGIIRGQELINFESSEHVYISKRINEIISENKSLIITEIGGGFGDLAYWFLKMTKSRVQNYYIVDLPLINMLQGYFLTKTFGEKNVAFYGEDKEALIKIVPTHAIKTIPKFDLMINTNSMPEIPKRAGEEYIRWAEINLKRGWGIL